MRVDASFEPTPHAPAEARHALRPLSRWLPDQRFVDVQTLVSELVTNGVKYGPGQPIDVHVLIDDQTAVLGEVRDHGTGDVRARALEDPAEGEGGLGLRIVDEIADSWGTSGDRSDVWFRVAL